MGCDIHLWVERQGNTGAWEFVGPPMLAHVGDFETAEEMEAFPGEVYGGSYDEYMGRLHKEWNNPFDVGRNYDLFAILANVRNGYGFAGVDTGDGFNIIHAPKGVPEDATEPYRYQVNRWGADGHSHSWLTLAELEAFDWEQTTKHRGWVSAGEYIAFKAKGKPESWSGAISGRDIKHVSHEEMERRIAEGTAAQCFTKLEWGESYKDSAARFHQETIPALRELGDPEKVRTVFFFDN